MGVVKRSVSLDDEVAEKVEQAAAEDPISFPTWLSDAAQLQLLLREGKRGVAEWEADAGPLTREERAAAEVLLDRLLAQTRNAEQGNARAS